MATKPTETLNFEPPDTSGANTITIAVPTDKQAAGFLPAEKPPAQYFNWLFRTLSRLYNYLKDGNFTGNHTITGTFGVTGATTITGNTAITGTLSASGLITATSGVTAGANQHVIVSGTGKLKHGDDKIVIPSCAWEPYVLASQVASGSVPVLAADGWDFAASPSGIADIEAAVHLPVGARVRTVKWLFNKGGSATALVMALRKRTWAGVSTTVNSVTDTTSGSSDKSEISTTIDYVMEDEAEIVLRVSSGNVAHKFRSAVITYDRPQ